MSSFSTRQQQGKEIDLNRVLTSVERMCTKGNRIRKEMIISDLVNDLSRSLVRVNVVLYYV